MAKTTQPGAVKKRRNNSVLNEEQRAWLVTAWATFKRPADIYDEFREKFGFDVKQQTAASYNCTGIRDMDHAKERGLAKWLPLHNKARTEFQDAIKDIPIADATYRMQQLDKLFEHAMAKGNHNSAARYLEQAAKEAGGAFSNRRVLEGQVQHQHEHEVPQDIMRSAVAHKIRDLIADGIKARAAEQEAALTQAKALPASETIIDG